MTCPLRPQVNALQQAWRELNLHNFQRGLHVFLKTNAYRCN